MVIRALVLASKKSLYLDSELAPNSPTFHTAKRCKPCKTTYINPPTNKKITTCLDCYNITIKTTAIQTIILNENIVDIEEFSLKLNDIINKSGVNNRDKFQYILDIHPDTKMGLISKLVKIMRDSKIKSMIYNSN